MTMIRKNKYRNFFQMTMIRKNKYRKIQFFSGFIRKNKYRKNLSRNN